MVQRLRPQWGRNRLEKTFQLARTCTKSTKSIIFQFKFPHRRLPTNSFCQEETDTLLHLFWQCKVTSLFWGTFFQWLQSCSLIQKGNHLVMTTALGLKPDSSNTKLQINFSCLMSRYYIWKCKLRDEIPNLPQFFRLLKKTYEIETNELNLHPEKWKPLLGHLKCKGLSAKICKTRTQTACPYQWYYWYWVIPEKIRTPPTDGVVF